MKTNEFQRHAALLQEGLDRLNRFYAPLHIQNAAGTALSKNAARRRFRETGCHWRPRDPKFRRWITNGNPYSLNTARAYIYHLTQFGAFSKDEINAIFSLRPKCLRRPDRASVNRQLQTLVGEGILVEVFDEEVFDEEASIVYYVPVPFSDAEPRKMKLTEGS